MLRDLLRQIVDVSEILGFTKIQADQFIAQLGDAMTVNVESITHRDTRQNGDYVQDTVQDELRKVIYLALYREFKHVQSPTY